MRVRERIRDLSPRGEFVLVTAVSFAYFIIGSVAFLFSHIRVAKFTTSRTVAAIATEVIILGAVAWILRIRSWRLARLTERISVPSVLAGIPLFIAYYVVYWITAIIVVELYPPAANTAAIQFVSPAPFWLLAVFIIINSIFEEMTVTAYVIAALSHEGFALSITVSTLLRFLYHVYQGPLASISILPLGVLFGVVYYRWRTVWPLVTAHTIMNLIFFALSR